MLCPLDTQHTDVVYCFPFRRAFMMELHFLPRASIVADNRQTYWEAYQNVRTETSSDTETGDKNMFRARVVSKGR